MQYETDYAKRLAPSEPNGSERRLFGGQDLDLANRSLAGTTTGGGRLLPWFPEPLFRSGRCRS